MVSQLDAAMWRDEFCSSVFLQWLAGVGPVEGVGHRAVVIIHELPELRFKVGHRGEVSPAQTLSMNDTEDDLNLIEPRTVFRKVDKTDSMTAVRQELLACGH